MPGPGRERPGEAEDFVTEEVMGYVRMRRNSSREMTLVSYGSGMR